MYISTSRFNYKKVLRHANRQQREKQFNQILKAQNPNKFDYHEAQNEVWRDKYLRQDKSKVSIIQSNFDKYRQTLNMTESRDIYNSTREIKDKKSGEKLKTADEFFKNRTYTPDQWYGLTGEEMEILDDELSNTFTQIIDEKINQIAIHKKCNKIQKARVLQVIKLKTKISEILSMEDQQILSPISCFFIKENLWSFTAYCVHNNYIDKFENSLDFSIFEKWLKMHHFSSFLDLKTLTKICEFNPSSTPRLVEFHVGPTNSGKSHFALNQFTSAKSGIYVAPLRLLAKEAFFKVKDNLMNQISSGQVKLALLTGQEFFLFEEPKNYIDLSDQSRLSTSELIYRYKITHLCVTAEKAPLSLPPSFEVGVIDEYQLSIDSGFRGYVFSNAILHLPCERLYLVGEVKGVDSWMKILTENNNIICEPIFDSMNNNTYSRLSPLFVDPHPIDINSLQIGDAIVAFSKNDCHDLAKSIFDHWSGSYRIGVLYGSLPPEIRSEIIKSHDAGDIDILICTDLLGFGVNLSNLKRVIFSTLLKFDGTSKRQLTESEIRQIGARCGRYSSIYDHGIVGIFSPENNEDSGFNSSLKSSFINKDINQILKAFKLFPINYYSEDVKLIKVSDYDEIDGNIQYSPYIYPPIYNVDDNAILPMFINHFISIQKYNLPLSKILNLFNDFIQFNCEKYHQYKTSINHLNVLYNIAKVCLDEIWIKELKDNNNSDFLNNKILNQSSYLTDNIHDNQMNRSMMESAISKVKSSIETNPKNRRGISDLKSSNFKQASTYLIYLFAPIDNNNFNYLLHLLRWSQSHYYLNKCMFPIEYFYTENNNENIEINSTINLENDAELAMSNLINVITNDGTDRPLDFDDDPTYRKIVEYIEQKLKNHNLHLSKEEQFKYEFLWGLCDVYIYLGLRFPKEYIHFNVVKDELLPAVTLVLKNTLYTR